jgi:hypothetical protein
MRWFFLFGTLGMGGIGLVLLVFWAFGGFQDLGLDAAGTVAVIFGVLVTSLLGVGLMALVFYSDRSNLDEDVYHASHAEADHESGSRPARGL